MTLGEKIFASHWVVDAAEDDVGVPAVAPGEAGFFRTDIRFSHEYVTPMSAIFFEQKVGEDAKVVIRTASYSSGIISRFCPRS